MDDLFNVKNKVVLITGATGYLGRIFTLELAKRNCTIILHGRDLKKLQALTHEIVSLVDKPTYYVLTFDIKDEDKINSKIKSLNINKIDCIINNASQTAPSCNFLDTSSEEFIDYYYSCISAYLVIKNSIHLLRKSNYPSIINISSMYGSVSPNPDIYGDSGMNNPIAYGCAKAALQQLTKYLACHLKDIRVNTISPGPFPKIEDQKDNPEFIKRLSNKNPMNRVGSPVELIGPLIFFMSKASSFVTGSNLPVDGGHTVW